MKSRPVVILAMFAAAGLLLTSCSAVAERTEVDPPGAGCPWPPSELGTPAAESDDPLAVTEANALEWSRFWQMVESIPSEPTAEDFLVGSSILGRCPLTEIVAFQARLTIALHALDGPENLRWFEANDPSGLGFASDDVFLYARCAAVLGGERSRTAAVEERTLDWGGDAPDLSGASEHLLYLALDAALSRGVSEEEYYDAVSVAVPLSFETGMNADRWG